MINKLMAMALLSWCVTLNAQNETKGAIIGTNFSIGKSVIASGGGQSIGTSFSLTGSIGQSVASKDSSSAN